MARTKIKAFTLLSIAVTASACAHVATNVTTLDPSVRLARTCPVGVKIYTAEDRVQRPYREVALINSTGEMKYSDEGEMYGSMRDKAAAIGANGIILGGIDEPSAISRVAADVAKTETVRQGRATAIYVAADSASSAAACANYKAPSWVHRYFGL